MEKQTSQLRHTLIYGGITGGIMSFFLLMLFFAGKVNNESLNIFVYLIYVIGVYISVRHYRDHVKDGYLNFKPAFSTGFLTCLFIGAVGSVYTYIQYKYMAPGLIEELIIQMQENMMDRGVPDEQIEMQSMVFSQYMTPGVLGLGIILSSAFWGALLSLLVASVLKKQDNPLINSQS